MFFENHLHCTVYQEILEHFMLPSADQFLKMLISFSSRICTCPHCQSTKSWLNDYGVGVLDWPANSPDLNLYGVLSRGR